MNSSPRRHLRGIDFTLRSIAITAVLLLTATVLQEVLLIVFAAILGACILRGAATWLHARIGLGTGWCLGLVIVLLVLLLGGVLWLQGPRVTAQAATVADTVSQQVKHLWSNLQDNPLFQRLMPRLKDQADSALGGLTSKVPGLASSALGVGGDLVVPRIPGCIASAMRARARPHSILCAASLPSPAPRRLLYCRRPGSLRQLPPPLRRSR